MRATRLLRLLHILAVRGRVTAGVLAAELEVSVRTVYRDVETLSGSGFPVFTESGPGGGIELLADFRSPFVILTPTQVALLLLLGPPAATEELGVGGELRDTYDKLALALRRSGLGAARRAVVVDAPRWFDQAPPVAHLDLALDAVLGHRRLRVVHRGVERTVEPLGLANKAGRWYLVCGPPGDERVMRMDRLGAVTATGGTFDEPAAFDLAAFWAAWSADFERRQPYCDVVVDIGPDVVEDLGRALGDEAGRRARAAQPGRDGWRQVTLRFTSPEAARHRLAGLGDRLRIVQPAALRAELADLARRTLAVNGDIERSPR